MTKLGDAWRRVHGMITSKPTNFSWLIDNRLAGSGLPTSYDEVEWLKMNGIKAILTVREHPLPREWVDGLEYMHIYSLDLMAPEIDDIVEGVEFIASMINANKPVLVHCAAGKGRTGLLLAAYLIKHRGLDVEKAIDEVRSLRPGSIQSEYQELALRLYYKHLNGYK
jgi:atypical dual specificity phosphatase